MSPPSLGPGGTCRGYNENDLTGEQPVLLQQTVFSGLLTLFSTIFQQIGNNFHRSLVVSLPRSRHCTLPDSKKTPGYKADAFVSLITSGKSWFEEMTELFNATFFASLRCEALLFLFQFKSPFSVLFFYYNEKWRYYKLNHLGEK